MLLFGFTYLFVALNYLLKLDTKPFAVSSTFVAVNAIVFRIVDGVTGSAGLGITPDIRWGLIWWAWAVLWGTAFVTDILKLDLKKFVPILQIAVGILTAWMLYEKSKNTEAVVLC